MHTQTPVVINHFSDVLCIWAYVAQIRIDELRREYNHAIQIEYHFTPVFGDVETRINNGWASKGGSQGYAQHVQEVAAQHLHIILHPDVWQTDIPKSSANAHLFLKAAQRTEITTTTFEKLI